MQVRLGNVPVYRPSHTRAGAASSNIQQAAKPLLQFSGQLNDQEMLGWLKLMEQKLKQGPLHLISAQPGSKPKVYHFSFRFCGEDVPYSLHIYSTDNEVFGAHLEANGSRPEGQNWPGMIFYLPRSEQDRVVRDNDNNRDIKRPVVEFVNNSKIQLQTTSENPQVLKQTSSFIERLIPCLQKAQLYSPAEKAANEYLQIQTRYKRALEDHVLGHLSSTEKDAAEDRYTKDMEVWEASLSPMARLERKSQREIREEVEALATKQNRDHSKLSSGPSFWQHLTALIGNNRILQFIPLS